MQTFLPFADFNLSAVVLDRQRLGKQRVENLQIMKAIIAPGTGYANHPATKMWRNHVGALGRYQEAICYEWANARGYKDTCLQKSYDLLRAWTLSYEALSDPPWLGDPMFHIAHQSNLLRKDPAHYGPLFPSVIAPDLEYIWPVQ